MTEITRVPLQPLAKGSIPKLWLGIAALALAGGAFAYVGKQPLVDVKTLTKGSGASPTIEDVAVINYVGRLSDGQVFDQHQAAVLPMAGVIPGFTKALSQMQKGGKYTVKIPAKLGYGDAKAGAIPPNSDLTFDIELIDFMNARQYQQQMMMYEQMRRAQQGKKGGNAGPEAGDPMGGQMPNM